MDKRYNTNLELRSLENALDALSQEPSESTLDFFVPDEAAQDSSIIRRLKKGLKDPKAVLAASLADPLNKMDFDTFKDTLLAVIDDLPDINALTKSAPKGDKSKSRSVDDDSNIMALWPAVKQAHHLAGVCLKKFSNSSAPSNTNNHQSNNASDIKLVNNSAAYVSVANAQINYSASDLFATSSPDPTITVRLGKRLCCDIDPIGNATVWPYRAAQRKRTTADAEIIYQKLCAMEARGKVRRVQDSELSIVCEPILIDKLDRADGKITKSLQKLFGTTSICPRTGVTVGFGTLLDTVINPKLVADGIAATVVHVQDDVLVSSQTIADGEKALRVLTDILTEYGFIINQEKSQSPAKSTTFCGLLLHGRTYRPLPAKREIPEATFNAAFNDFLNGKAPPKRRGRRRVKHSAESLRHNRLSWLRSWTGVFNYFSGHLLPDAIAALRTLNGAIKHYQDEATSADFLETLTTPTSDAFKVLLRAYIAGTLPSSLGNDGIGTLAVVDANNDSYGAIIFKVFELSGDATEFATYSKTVFNCIPNLGEPFNISEDRVAILPLRVCGERFPHTVICLTNDEADDYNAERLADLPGEGIVIEAIDTDGPMPANLDMRAIAKVGFRETVVLKVACPVIATSNDIRGRYSNGLVGVVERITPSPKGREVVWVKFKGYGSPVSVGREKFTVHDIDGSILFARRQVPLTLAFAITAHRSVGLTLEGVWARLPCNKDRAEKRSYPQDRLWEQSWLTHQYRGYRDDLSIT
ncbi:hypothetical protein Pmar_PMAR022219 [Perkinsus marinus ATCC 50983]|uniref:Reverse transcriptase domain-containing protein n=1 Tax=Perkinsus marinus (strain ATCC 50983 / TXsc) TaxID=423536 RepID=C5LKF9_PERM5|nr:hypothetical protein Pmar_PMAR022219 [Perkinsus marinus ATCC 50983]EER02793.1 hypothetical protein Pmar_PMAR022219 [Perkinsus marinus ATCC 50983]|eukprot:XP_002770977.1 hypothetical protein Pmar_PMAR022219 [Perkinsus marinus ATCC 50983]